MHRRFLKTHLPLDGLPYWESTKYIYVGRDSRDVFMSAWNHFNGSRGRHTRGRAVLGEEMGMFFEGGAGRFLYKGTNDRWRDVLTSDDVALYEAAAARTLTPERRRWLERGSASGIDPKS